MSGKAKLETLNQAWYGFVFFTALVNLLGAVIGAGLFALVAVPFVIGVSLFSFFVAWAIGKLLLKKSRLTRLAVLVLSPLGILSGAFWVWNFLGASWTLSSLMSTVVVVCGIWMKIRTMRTLLDPGVKSYFA